MKAEINELNKAKFFALYWDEGSNEIGTTKRLHLKDVDLISRAEDKIMINFHRENNYDSKLEMVFGFDYLRSRGYALPWMGLSIEEMVEAGWIKLITK